MTPSFRRSWLWQLQLTVWNWHPWKINIYRTFKVRSVPCLTSLVLLEMKVSLIPSFWNSTHSLLVPNHHHWDLPLEAPNFLSQTHNPKWLMCQLCLGLCNFSPKIMNSWIHTHLIPQSVHTPAISHHWHTNWEQMRCLGIVAFKFHQWKFSDFQKIIISLCPSNFALSNRLEAAWTSYKNCSLFQLKAMNWASV